MKISELIAKLTQIQIVESEVGNGDVEVVISVICGEGDGYLEAKYLDIGMELDEHGKPIAVIEQVWPWDAKEVKNEIHHRT